MSEVILYARINDPRLSLGDEFILFEADALPPFKIGYFNPHGWLAYYIDGIFCLFFLQNGLI